MPFEQKIIFNSEKVVEVYTRAICCLDVDDNYMLRLVKLLRK